EALHARRRPRDHVARDVGDRDDGVVERRGDVSDPALDVLLDLLDLGLALRLGRATGPTGLFGHDLRSRLGRRGGRRSRDALTLPRALARARVGVRSLAAHRKALAMAQAAVAAEVHQALDVHRDLATKIAFDLQLALLDRLADATRFILVEIVGALVQRHVGRLQDLARESFADPVDVSERNFHPLVARKVDACESSHSLPLPLLVPLVLADHPHDTASADHLAFVTYRFD